MNNLYKSILFVMLLTILVISLIPATTITQAQEKKIVLRTHGWWMPPRRYNPFAPKSLNIVGIFFERLAMWNKMKNEFEPWLAESWEIKKDQNVVVIHLRKNVYWHDGTPFTAKDVWTTLMIYKALGRTVWNYIDDVKVVDDYTVEYHVKNWGYLLTYYILFRDGEICAPHHIFGQFAEKIAKATSQDELNQIKKDLIDFKLDKVVGTGPFKFVKLTESELVVEKFDKHWAADKIPVDEIVFPFITSNEVGWLHYQAGDLDYDVFMMPPQVYDSITKLPHAGVVMVYDLSGFALVFNFDNPYLKDARVRQAIAYVIDRSKVAWAAGGKAFDPVDYPTGILKVVEDQWISDIKSYLDKYEVNPSKAEQLLKEAGFSKGADGKWRTPDGNVFTLTLIAPAGYTDWVAAAKEIAAELNNFGITVELRTPETSSYWSNQWYLGGHYDMAMDFFGAWMTYPWAAFERMFIEVNNIDKTIVQGKGFEVFYNIDLGGPFSGKADVRELVNTLASSWDPNEQKEAAQKLAWIANHYLPEYPIAEKRLMIFINKQHFIWPDPEKHFDLYQNAAGGHLEALSWMLINGYIQPNPEYWGVTTTTTTTTTTTPAGGATATITKTVTTTETKTETVTVGGGLSTGIAAVLVIIALIIGIIIGYFIKRK